ncbi:MAG: WbqC family protein [Christiangramia sp.]|uniref:WbqC family protein n=1 Tax=Christiangramia sp. TaxID=1931228 RepID=UPI003242985F
MKKALFHPSYFGPVSLWVALSQTDQIIFENEDNYQKQTYRNRMYIYDANGKLNLNIPVKHSSALGLDTNGRQKYQDVQIENDFDWQVRHWRALQTSYQTSPFFEFYEDECYPLYEKKFKFLMDFNYRCMEFAAEAMQFDLEFAKTSEYILEPENVTDLRSLVLAKRKQPFQNEPYTQVFSEKLKFENDLSILDLLFNEGPNTLAYLQRQEL